MGLRAERADETRKRLFRAAAELFAARGYHETTVDDIARKAGVAKGTFFVHFPTKDAVIVELVRRQVRVAARARAQAGGPAAALRAVPLALGVEAAESRALGRAILAATLERPDLGGDVLFGEITDALVADARAAGLADP